MKPAPFNLLRPKSVDEALALLQSHGEEAKVLAGGQSLVPLMNFRLAQPHSLIDLNGVEGLDQIKFDDQTLTLGAMVRQRDVERSASIAKRLPILREAIEQVAHPAIRNRGTAGGSLVHADPSAELPLLAVALDATFHLRSAQASRSVAAKDFYQGYLLTDIAPDELLVATDFHLPPADSGWCCTEIARRHGDFAIVAVAVLLGCGRDRKIDFARIALGGVGPAPLALNSFAGRVTLRRRR
jgi:CO/xanthine dehydrogenase FAD-binding subunit